MEGATVAVKTRFECVLIGEARVGKTCIKEQLFNRGAGALATYEATFGGLVMGDRGENTLNVSLGDGTKVALNLHDSAGELRYRASSNRMVYNIAEVLVYVFDVTSKESLKDFENWKKTIIYFRKCAIPEKFPISLGIVAIGNKIDSTRRVISYEEASTWCKANGIRHYFEVSAKTRVNLEEAFCGIAALLYDKVIDCNKEDGI